MHSLGNIQRIKQNHFPYEYFEMRMGKIQCLKM
jgi:hypothetical protein